MHLASDSHSLDLCLLCRLVFQLGYNGQVPGPTIRQKVGRQSLLRVTNNIQTSPEVPQFHPCDTATRTGRPITVHFHGSASLAPYDGWAEDSICTGETKDYVYPNNRPTTGWYHDHQLELTAPNAYRGLAGFYILEEEAAAAPGGNANRSGLPVAPWNLATVNETLMMLADKSFDSSCQLTLELEVSSSHPRGHY